MEAASRPYTNLRNRSWKYCLPEEAKWGRFLTWYCYPFQMPLLVFVLIEVMRCLVCDRKITYASRTIRAESMLVETFHKQVVSSDGGNPLQNVVNFCCPLGRVTSVVGATIAKSEPRCNIFSNKKKYSSRRRSRIIPAQQNRETLR